MKIHQDLVFDRSGEIIGYVDTGDCNNKIRSLENLCKGKCHNTIATHMLTLMVRGLALFQVELMHNFLHQVVNV